MRNNAFGIQRFSAPPLVCSAPGAESNSAGGAETKTGGAEFFFTPFGRDSAPPDFFLPPLKKFSAPAKINPAHATENRVSYLTHLRSISNHFLTFFSFLLKKERDEEKENE